MDLAVNVYRSRQIRQGNQRRLPTVRTSSFFTFAEDGPARVNTDGSNVPTTRVPVFRPLPAVCIMCLAPFAGPNVFEQ